ncbi:unnamed protein product, partial [marine sediment metagenome]
MRSKLGCFIFLMITMTSLIFAGTVYYVDATNGNDLNDGLSPATAWQTILKVNRSFFSPGDSVLFKRDEIWREQLIIPSSGLSGSPITIAAYGSGNKPIINGSDLVIEWTNYNVNAWQSILATEPRCVWLDGNFGDKKTSIGELADEYDWYHDGSNTLYVYSTSDPDTAYTSPGIEAAERNNGVYASNKNYLLFQNLHIKQTAQEGFYFNVSDNVEINSCTTIETFYAGIRMWKGTNFTIDGCIINHAGRVDNMDYEFGINFNS